MTPTIHIHRAQQSAARIQALADPHRPVHAQPIIMPTRPQPAPRGAWVGLALAISCMLAFAAIAGLIAATLIKR